MLDLLFNWMDKIEEVPQLLIDTYSIFVCYTSINFSVFRSQRSKISEEDQRMEENTFNAIFVHNFFKNKENFSERIQKNIKKVVESPETTESGIIIDLSLQILRNLITNKTISHQNTIDSGILKTLQSIVNNNKRINIAAQIISELSYDNQEVQNYILEEKYMLNWIIDWIQDKGNVPFKSSLLTCLINLCINNPEMTNYIRENLEISNLISIIKYQYSEINWKVAYLATILWNDNRIDGEFFNLIKQIIFQIARMLQSKEVKIITEGTTMLHNLVKVKNVKHPKLIQNTAKDTESAIHSENIFNSKFVLTKNIHSDIIDVGILEHLADILKNYSELYIVELKKLNEKKPSTEEEKDKEDEWMVDASSPYPDITTRVPPSAFRYYQNMKENKIILMNSLRIVKFIMEANEGWR